MVRPLSVKLKLDIVSRLFTPLLDSTLVVLHSLAHPDAESFADASVFGFLNFVTRPLGGFLGDYIYRYYGIKGKKYLTVALGFLQGAMSLAMGLVSFALLRIFVRC